MTSIFFIALTTFDLKPSGIFTIPEKVISQLCFLNIDSTDEKDGGQKFMQNIF